MNTDAQFLRGLARDGSVWKNGEFAMDKVARDNWAKASDALIGLAEDIEKAERPLRICEDCEVLTGVPETES